jgi:hypothetical protein
VPGGDDAAAQRNIAVARTRTNAPLVADLIGVAATRRTGTSIREVTISPGPPSGR